MKAKRLLALLLALTMMLFGVAAGNPETETADGAEASVDVETLPDIETETDDGTRVILDTLAAAQAKHAADETVCTINGESVSWTEYYYLLTDELLSAVYYMGGLPEDYNLQLTEDMTIGEYLKNAATAKATYYAVPHAVMTERGLSLTAEQEQEVSDYVAELEEAYGGPEALREAMAESNLTPEVFAYLLTCNAEMGALMEADYGLNGENMAEEDVLTWAGEQGYVHVKHILYFNRDETTGGELDEAALAERKEKAESVCAELRAIEDMEEREARFDEIMLADSGDAGGLSSFADGYTFVSGTMYPEFEDASFALADYEISDVVESTAGYHVIMRLPLSGEDLTINQNSNDGSYLTLRQSAANDLFSRDMAAWIDSAEVEWAPGFENMDLNELFDAPGVSAPAASSGSAEPVVAVEKKSWLRQNENNYSYAQMGLGAVAVIALATLFPAKKKEESEE